MESLNSLIEKMKMSLEDLQKFEEDMEKLKDLKHLEEDEKSLVE